MAGRFKPEKIAARLRQVDVPVAQGVRGLKVDQVKRLKDLETANRRLCEAVADLTLDKPVLAEAARGNH